MPAALNGQGWRATQVRKFAPHRATDLWQHAILDSDGRIVALRLYERSNNPSRSVIPIPDDCHPRVGWWYNRRTRHFQRERPE